MASTIEPVAGRRDFARFVDHPYARYAGDPHWIPPLRIAERARLTPGKNPFFEHAEAQLFLARRNGRIAGRIAAIDDRLHRQLHGDAIFGLFEADDAETARALLAAAEDWARRRGRDRMRGPINLSLHDSCGLLIDGFDRDPMLLMTHNPPEYARFIEDAGYVKAKDLLAWIWDTERGLPDVIVRLADRFQERAGVTLRAIEPGEVERQADRLRDLYASAWERNWGFVAPTPREFRHIVGEMKPIFDPRCAVVAESDGRMVACIVALPDVNQALKGTDGRLFPFGLVRLLRRRRYIDQARLILLGVEPAFRTAGLFPMLIVQLYRQIAGSPYRRLEFSWVLEDNHDVNQAAQLVGARRDKTYRIYHKALV